MMSYMRGFIHLVILTVAGGSLWASAWTQYRGANQDGTYAAPIRTNWTQEAPRILWRVPMPFGLSSFSVAQGRLYTMGARQSANQAPLEYCIALNSETGAEVWSTPIDVADYPHGGVGADDGPRSTPTVDGDRVYAFGAYMNVVCMNVATGATIWSNNLVAIFGSQIITWQNAASPTVVDDLVFVNSNGRLNEHLIAFRKGTGAVAWKVGSFGMTHATPVGAKIGGVQQILFLGQTALVSVNATNGAVLWSFPLRYNGTSVAASPVVVDDTVYISRAYPGSTTNPQAGALVVQIRQTNNIFSATRKWEKVNQLMNHWATPVYFDGHYYGIYGQSSLSLRCVEAANGNSLWEVAGFGYGSITRVNNQLLVLSDRGDLVLAEPNPQRYLELARIRPVTGRCWNNPAVSDGRIYIRSTTEAVAIDVSLPNTTPAPPLKLGGMRVNGGRFTIEISTEDNSPIDPGRASTIATFSGSDLTAPGGWLRVTNSTVLTNGKLTLEGSAVEPMRFFRSEEPR